MRMIRMMYGKLCLCHRKPLNEANLRSWHGGELGIMKKLIQYNEDHSIRSRIVNSMKIDIERIKEILRVG